MELGDGEDFGSLITKNQCTNYRSRCVHTIITDSEQNRDEEGQVRAEICYDSTLFLK